VYLMSLRGQSTVEPMLALTGVLLALVVFGYVRHDLFQQLVIRIAEWVATLVEIP